MIHPHASESSARAHVRQWLGYGRFGDLELRGWVDELDAQAWLPLRNYFTPVMKLVGTQRDGSKVRKQYATLATPCDRLLACVKISEETKEWLRATRAALDPMELAADIKRRLERIFAIVARIEEDRQDEIARAGWSAGPCQIHTETRTSNQMPGVMNPGATTKHLRCHVSLAQYGSSARVFEESENGAGARAGTGVSMRWGGAALVS